ncbi:hypothetical protein [Nostoc sp.]|uniref:hypothetical protein n=1 Tax=Nostoc sp. TaxID=1180 RepID=UPI002FF6F214
MKPNIKFQYFRTAFTVTCTQAIAMQPCKPHRNCDDYARIVKGSLQSFANDT